MRSFFLQITLATALVVAVLMASAQAEDLPSSLSALLVSDVSDSCSAAPQDAKGCLLGTNDYDERT